MLTRKLTLSALQPIKLSHAYDSDLKVEYKQFNSGLRYYDHNALKNFADISFSNESALILTKRLPYNQVFNDQQKTLTVKDLCGMFILYAKDNETLMGDTKIKFHPSGKFFVGGNGQDAIFNVVPASNNKIYLRFNKKRIQVTQTYPYDLYLSEDELPENESYRELFEIVYKSKKIQFKIATKEGTRYLSFGVDRILRGVGLELNKLYINSYSFDVQFFGSESLLYGLDQNAKEVKYYNTNESLSEKKALNLKLFQQQDTNLLIDFPIIQAQTSTQLKTNIALLKTNFTSTGTFNTSLSL